MIQEVRFITTHKDLHGRKAPMSELELFVESVNGERALRVGVGHDVTVPPLGKVLSAHIEALDDGEFALVGTQEVFDDLRESTLPDGTIVLEQSSETDHRPFIIELGDAPDELEIIYDSVNFENDEDLNAFLKDIREIAPFTERPYIRKNLSLPPEFIIRLTSGIILYLAGKKILERAGDKIVDQVIDDISMLYELIKKSSINFMKYTIDKNKPVTYVFEAIGNPKVEFITRTKDVDLILSAIVPEKTTPLFERAYELKNSLGAEKIQYLLNSEGEWEFNYLLTNDGKTMGIRKSFSRRTQILSMMDGTGLSISGIGEPIKLPTE